MFDVSSTQWHLSSLARTCFWLMVDHSLPDILFRLNPLLPDSIVRGTTSKEIIQMAKDVGAKKVIVASCAPPIR